MSEAFVEAFSLMNANENGSISLEEVYGFTELLNPPPLKSKVKAIYNEFDADGSGDIDQQEFLGMCHALEKLTGKKTNTMVQEYSDRCYLKLFALVDDGDGNVETATISKEELKLFFDSCPELGQTSQDVAVLFRTLNQPELGFGEFRSIVRSVMKGRSISAVLKSFKEGKDRRKAARSNAMRIFNSALATKRMEKALKPAQPPKPKFQSQTTDEMFREAFTLMDSRGMGALPIETVFNFCDVLPKPPSKDDIRRIYKEFDADNSGDIDANEFLGLCKELEQLTLMSTGDMCQHYTRAMFKRLFELVDDDGSGTIGKDELRTMLESISPLISSRYSASDLFEMVRDTTKGDLVFDDFCGVVSKLTAGKSISQVVKAFEEVVHWRKDKTNKAATDATHQILCFACMEKEQTIRQLKEELAVAKAEIAQFKGGAAAASADKSIREIMAEDTMLGDPFQNITVLRDLTGAPSYRKYPEFARPAIHHAQGLRLGNLVSFFENSSGGSTIQSDAVVHDIHELLIPEVEEIQGQLRALADPIVQDVGTCLGLLRQQVTAINEFKVSQDKGRLQELQDTLTSYRINLKALRPDIAWALDALVDKRDDLCNKALCVAPYTSKAHAVVLAVKEVEVDTQLILDHFTVLFMLCTDQLTDIEIVAKRILLNVKTSVEDEEIDALRDIASHLEDSLTKEALSKVLDQGRNSLHHVRNHIAVASSMKRDKGLQTMPAVDAPPVKLRRDHHEDPRDKLENIRSASPRIRQKTKQHRDQVAAVDRILDQYVNGDGVDVPQNFRRCEPGTNQFMFGTKKIELVPVDKFAVVKVGGGYLMFDEFCQKYCEAENRRFIIKEGRSDVEIIKSYNMTPRSTAPLSAMTTPRTGAPERGGTTPRTPRTLVRSGGKLNIF